MSVHLIHYAFQVLIRKEAFADEMAADGLLQPSLATNQRHLLEGIDEALTVTTFSEPFPRAASRQDFGNVRPGKHVPVPGNLADQGPLFLLPYDGIDQVFPGNHTGIVKELSYQQGASRQGP